MMKFKSNQSSYPKSLPKKN